jgi:hypothetical protein
MGEFSDFIDATQSYTIESSIETSITNTEITEVSNDDLLSIPTTSDANNLIRLVNNGAGVNNLYIIQANANGEIRFLQGNASNNNDVGETQPYNVKIGTDGKLYIYWTYNFLSNPLRFSGWYDIAEDVASQGNQLSLLELATIALEAQITIANTNIGILDTTLSGFISTQNAINIEVNTTLNEHTAEIGALATQVAVLPNLQRFFNGSAFVNGNRRGIAGLWRRSNWKDAQELLANRYTSRVVQGRVGSVMVAERTLQAVELEAFELVSNTASVAMNRAIGDISTAFGIVGAGAILAGIYRYYTNAQEDQRNDLIKDLVETKEDMILQQANTPNPFYTTQNRITKASLVIDASTDNAYGGAVGVYEVEGLTQYTGVVLNMEIYLDGGIKKARVVSVVSGGGRVWVVGNQIQIPKSTKLGGYDAGVGTIDLLKIDVVSVFNPLEVVDETINGLIAEQADEDRRDRRRKGVIGAGEYDTTTLTTASATETNSITGEVITYNTLKSRLNLLPTGASDVDVYTSTGKIGVGTTPETPLHTYNATNNILRIATADSGEASLELKRGTDVDGYTDWRMRSKTGRFELQYEDDVIAYGDTGSEIFSTNTTLLTISKDTQINANVGIGTTASTTLNTYHLTDNILRMETGAGTTAKTQIQFVKGTTTDINADFRLISELAFFKLQYSTNILAFGDTGSDLISARATSLTLHKNTTLSANVGIGGVNPHATYKVNVGGDVNISSGSSYRINGAVLSYNNLANKLTAGANITIDANNEISADVPTANNLLSTITSGTLAVAYGGTGANDILANAIPFGNATEDAYTYTTNFKYDAPNGRLAVGLPTASYTIDCGGDINIPLTSNYRIGGSPLSYNNLADKLTAGTNITITSGVIDAIVPAQLTAGTNITITSGAINAIVPAQLTAGTNIDITSGVISAVVPTTFSASAITSGTLAIARGGTGTTTIGNGTIPIGNATQNAYTWTNLFKYDLNNARLSLGVSTPLYTLDVAGSVNISSGNSYRVNGTALTFTNLTGTCPVSKGGTGLGVVATGVIPFGNLTSDAYSWRVLFNWDDTNLRLGVNKTSPAYTIDTGGDINIPTGSVYRIGGTALSYTNLTNQLTAGTNITITSGAINASISTIDAGAITTGTLPVGRGGTGATSYTSGNILYGSGTSPIASSTNLKYVSNRLGINMSGTPLTNLHIGATFFSSSGFYTFFDYNSGNIGFTNASRTDVCAYFQGSLWLAGGRFLATSSDTRIKKDIEDIDDDSALNMILAVEPKTYKYIDNVALGNNRVYGFIAQQIKEVIPQAVKIQKERIPNVMLLATYNNNIITLPSQPVSVVIKVGDTIKCYDKDNKEIVAFVDEVIDTLTFRIKELEEPYTDTKIFIYGTEIDDFHTIDKNYIYTLNVCATQELHRKIVSQEERIRQLEEKVERLLNYLT